MDFDLEYLAEDCCENFLNLKTMEGIPLQKNISLYGAEEEILEKFKSLMASYFERKKKNIQIESNSVNSDYNIDVGYLLKFNNHRRVG